ncbi:hypothetical protein HPB52_010335 [Rhipicephalus sanguineus]|uniref:Uncharacterized protein n=1 Tax=Rhipicephalus sanguineus TaxID=34632 RepID=A0A9D4SNF0_RHISA|nr:hypothetical protein HPB52_010335 [Rhipicephalus sanguineus]
MFKYYFQVQQHKNNSKNGTGTKGTTIVIGQQQGGDQDNTTRINSATQPNSQSTGYRDAVRGTPLTEASQARQETATVLQQAPSGSREHSSSRGRAAAHGHYTSHGHGTNQGQGASRSDPGGAASEMFMGRQARRHGKLMSLLEPSLDICRNVCTHLKQWGQDLFPPCFREFAHMLPQPSKILSSQPLWKQIVVDHAKPVVEQTHLAPQFRLGNLAHSFDVSPGGDVEGLVQNGHRRALVRRIDHIICSL